MANKKHNNLLTDTLGLTDEEYELTLLYSVIGDQHEDEEEELIEE